MAIFRRTSRLLSNSEMQRVAPSPGAPADHINGEWWHIDIICHLEYDHLEPHTRACPMEYAQKRHRILHGIEPEEEQPPAIAGRIMPIP